MVLYNVIIIVLHTHWLLLIINAQQVRFGLNILHFH